jgi:two pore calcium channel protein
MFTVFFPGVTGVIGGTNLSNNLRDPKASLSQGIISATLFAYAIYILVSLVLASAVPRAALQTDIHIMMTVVDNNLIVPIVYVGVCCTTLSSALSYLLGAQRVLQTLADDQPSTSVFFARFQSKMEVNPQSRSSMDRQQHQRRSNKLISGAAGMEHEPAGVSSGEGSLNDAYDTKRVSTNGNAQETSQKAEVTVDPNDQQARPPSSNKPWRIRFTHQERAKPAVSTVFCTWFVAQVIVFNGTVDQMAPFVTTLFLLTFCVINFTCLLHELSRPLYWQPAFRLYSKWSAASGLAGSGLALMASGEWYVGLGAVVFFFGVMYLHRIEITHVLQSGEKKGDRQRRQKLRSTGGEVSYRQRIQRAAMFIQDAHRGRFRGEEWGEGDSAHTQILAKKWFHRLKPIRDLNLTIFLLISFFERPSWCYDTLCTVDHTSSGQVPPDSRLPKWHISSSMGVEGICLLLFGAHMTLKKVYMGRYAFLHEPWHLVQTSMIGASTIGVLISAAQPHTLTMLNPVLRPLLAVSMSRRVRKGFRWILLILPNFAEVTVLITYFLVFFACCGALLFTAITKDEAIEEFKSLGWACWSLLILLTGSANFPDVMVPLYNKHPATCIFFIVFLVVGLFFLTNLLLAVAYQSYAEQLEYNMHRFSEKRRQSMEVAFKLLDLSGDGYISISEMKATLDELDKPVVSLSSWSFMKEEDEVTIGKSKVSIKTAVARGLLADLMAQLVHVQEEENREIELHSFDFLFSAKAGTKMKEHKRRQKTAIRRASKLKRFSSPQLGQPQSSNSGSLLSVEDVAVEEEEEEHGHSPGHHYHSRVIGIATPTSPYRRVCHMCHTLVIQSKFEMGVNALGMAQIAVLFWLMGNLNAHEHVDLKHVRAINAVQVATDVLFVLELGMRFLALQNKSSASLKKKSPWGVCVDAVMITSIIALDGAVLAGLFEDETASNEISIPLRCAVGARVLRSLRVLATTRRFRTIAKTFMQLLPAVSTLLGVEMAIFMVFAQVGVALFGGDIYKGNPKLAGLAFETSDYFKSSNFNDFGSGLVTLFELLMINNWQVIVEAYVATNGEVARVFFISFWLLSNLLVLNLLVAYILDAFFRKQQEAKKREANEQNGHKKETNSFELRDMFLETRREMGTGGGGLVSVEETMRY